MDSMVNSFITYDMDSFNKIGCLEVTPKINSTIMDVVSKMEGSNSVAIDDVSFNIVDVNCGDLVRFNVKRDNGKYLVRVTEV